jgi:MFS family permease
MSIVGWSIFIWSMMTALGAFARNFMQLFLVRAGVGIGEAGLSPAANSLISDYFPPDRLAKPIAFYSAGSLLGPALAMIGGGAIVDHLIARGTVAIPLVGQQPAWQLIFLVAAVPGLVLACIFRFLPEPPRHGRSTASDSSLRENLAYAWSHRAFLGPHFVGAALTAMCTIALAFWIPTYMVRAFGLQPGQAGAYYGGIALVAGVSGLGFAGWAADAIGKRGRAAGHIIIPLAAALVAAVPLVGAIFVTELSHFLTLAAIGTFFAAAIMPLAPVALQIYVPNEKRGQIFSFYLLTISLLGYALGPFIVAFVTERVFMDETKLGLSLAMLLGSALPLAALCFFRSWTRYRNAGFV